MVIFDGVARLMGASSGLGFRGWLLQPTRSTTAMKERMVSLTLVSSSQLSVNLEFFAFRVLITLR